MRERREREKQDEREDKQETGVTGKECVVSISAFKLYIFFLGFDNRVKTT